MKQLTLSKTSKKSVRIKKYRKDIAPEGKDRMAREFP
tara:strand:+ start:429 stop:539 length:111 start_codon:yes stop_codon:yes gene_type:complete